MSIPTTLNSAGCDADRMEEMDLGRDGFLEAQLNIVDAYTKLGIRPTRPARRTTAEGFEEGIACWAESNAMANSRDQMRTPGIGPSALATAPTGFAPRWGSPRPAPGAEHPRQRDRRTPHLGRRFNPRRLDRRSGRTGLVHALA